MILLGHSALLADGLLLPVAENYPSDLMRLRMTKVNVTINGVVAQISVYQEFVNEWDQSTDAVYSFPLPPNARATQFLYWYEDKIYMAVLKVQEQAPNPGTGEGGVAAEINKYIGRNGIKIALENIKPGMIQKVQLDYIQMCNYFQGEVTFEYPLATTDFITYPLDHLEFNFMVVSNSHISTFDIPTHTGMETKFADDRELHVTLQRSKAYINNNLIFTYQTDQTQMGLDFYSVANDSTDGHFALVIRPANTAPADSILPRRIIFLLSNSSSMAGYKLSQSISAIGDALDRLNQDDVFNIVIYNYWIQHLMESAVPATLENIQQAKILLTGITPASGSRMDLGIEDCFDQISDDQYSNAVIAFTDGLSYIDPIQIENQNSHRTGIFPIAIGDNFNFARLEMLAAYNYGFVTYIGNNDNMLKKMSRLLQQVTQPVLKDVSMEFGQANLSQILHEKLPSVYAGTYFFTTGRYANSTLSALSIGGTSVMGPVAYDFLLNFTASKDTLRFTESIWAKAMIDYLEWMIEIYGETAERKKQLIGISLKYNIRCRYTAYVADYQTEYPSEINIINSSVIVTSSHLITNYPNPFNPSTIIRFFISPLTVSAGPKLLKIFNMLGQLVMIIDLSEYGAGYHEIRFNGRDIFGRPLPSGIYVVVLQTGTEISTMRIALIR